MSVAATGPVASPMPLPGLPARPGRPARALPAAPAAVPCWTDGRPLDTLLGLCRRQGRLSSVLVVELQPADPQTAAALLQAVGQRLRSRVRVHDDVAQTGPDTLAVLLRDVGDAGSRQVRSRLESDLRQPYRVQAATLRPLLRIGRAVAGLDGQRAADLLRVAGLNRPVEAGPG